VFACLHLHVTFYAFVRGTWLGEIVDTFWPPACCWYQLLHEAVRKGSVDNMVPEDREALNNITSQLYQADPAIKYDLGAYDCHPMISHRPSVDVARLLALSNIYQASFT